MKKRIEIYVALLLAVSFAASLFIGPAADTPDIIFGIRLPRVFQGLVVGFSLAVAGTIFQGVLKNPLADPYILGTSSGALLGAVIYRVSGAESPVFFYLAVAFFAMSATAASYFIASHRRKANNVDLILAGVIVSAFLGAVILFFMHYSRESALNILFFMMGGLYENDRAVLLAVFLLTAAGFAASLPLARYLDIFAVGEEKARVLGVNVTRYKIIFFLIASSVTSFAVAISGTIGFIGLIVPHAARALSGAGHFRLLIVSAMLGGLVLIAADAAARTVLSPVEIPVGVVTAMFGAPFFLHILSKRKSI